MHKLKVLSNEHMCIPDSCDFPQDSEPELEAVPAETVTTKDATYSACCGRR